MRASAIQTTVPALARSAGVGQTGDMTERATERRAPHRRHVTRSAELLDVELLDVLAQIESLLRNGREIQREALRVRGAPVNGTRAQRVAAAARIPKIIGEMEGDVRSLVKVLRTLRTRAAQLHKSTRARRVFGDGETTEQDDART
jgi:hypothetical protein